MLAHPDHHDRRACGVRRYYNCLWRLCSTARCKELGLGRDSTGFAGLGVQAKTRAAASTARRLDATAEFHAWVEPRSVLVSAMRSTSLRRAPHLSHPTVAQSSRSSASAASGPD